MTYRAYSHLRSYRSTEKTKSNVCRPESSKICKVRGKDLCGIAYICNVNRNVFLSSSLPQNSVIPKRWQTWLRGTNYDTKGPYYGRRRGANNDIIIKTNLRFRRLTFLRGDLYARWYGSTASHQRHVIWDEFRCCNCCLLKTKQKTHRIPPFFPL